MNRAASILLTGILCACAGGNGSVSSAQSDFTLAGRIADNAIREASGISRSSRDDRLWVINDGGSPAKLHAIGMDGSQHGSVVVEHARNIDWEDLTSYEENGKHWLVIADIGDNSAKRDHCTLYIVEEPGDAQIAAGHVPVQRQISFVYPDGARDAESAAIDFSNQQILILTKRDIPAVLYALPLYPAAGEIVTATRIGAVMGVPQPTAYDIERALPDLNWHWQPNAMSLSADNTKAAILTYRATYVFERMDGQSWLDALQQVPMRYDLGPYKEAEAVVFSNDATKLFATTENRNPPLLRLDQMNSPGNEDLDD